MQVAPRMPQTIDELHAAKMPRLGERAPPEKRLSIDDGAMASKADVSSAAKPNKTTMPGAPRMPQTAAISATQAPIALTAVTAMATGSEGAEAGAEESAAAAVATQLPMNRLGKHQPPPSQRSPLTATTVAEAAAARPAGGMTYTDLPLDWGEWSKTRRKRWYQDHRK